MRISLITAPPEAHHGWGQYTLELARQLLAAGIDLTIITGLDAPAQPDLPIDPANYHRVLPSVMKPKRFNSLRLLRAGSLVRHLSATSDLIHILTEPYALTAIGIQKPLVVTAHGTYLPLTVERRLWGSLFRQVYERSRIICVSRYTEEQVRAVLRGAQTIFIANGVHPEHFRQQVPPVARQGPTVVAVGQLKPRKGFDVLARAMKTVCEKLPSAYAVFIGDTSDEAYVQQIQSQLAADGLTSRVRFAGRVSDEIKIGWLQAADVFALPAVNTGGKFEGFGLVYLEASAAGVPVIGTLGNGAEDAIRDGETGFLIPQGDETALADRIIRLMSDPSLRQRMGSAGWAFADDHAWSKVAAQVAALYREVLS